MKRIKWGVIGTAGIAKGCTIPGMCEADNCELYAIAGRDINKAEQFKDEFGFEKAYGSYEDLLSDASVEAVYIPLPNDMHYEWIMKAIEHGKNVLCEKPLAPTAKEVEELFQAAEKAGVLLTEAFAYQHSPYIQALSDEIESGTIGKVSYIESAFLTSDYDKTNIRMNKSNFGGATYDLGCYCTSMFTRLIDSDFKEVRAVADFNEDGVDKFNNAYIKYENGVLASMSCGMIFETEMSMRADRLWIHGDQGDIRSYVEYNQAGSLEYSVVKNGVETVKTVDSKQNYRLEVEKFGRVIADGEKPVVTADFSIRNAKLLDAILKEIDY